jgi:hypothetical protein
LSNLANFQKAVELGTNGFWAFVCYVEVWTFNLIDFKYSGKGLKKKGDVFTLLHWF